MKKIELVKDKLVDKTIEVTDEQFPGMMYRMKLRAELLKRDTAEEWQAREHVPPVPPPTAEEIAQREYEEKVAEKERDILRKLAIDELTAEVKEK